MIFWAFTATPSCENLVTEPLPLSLSLPPHLSPEAITGQQFLYQEPYNLF